jgi:hypothetical protein
VSAAFRHEDNDEGDLFGDEVDLFPGEEEEASRLVSSRARSEEEARERAAICCPNVIESAPGG